MTLLETLIAFVIAALSLGMVVHTVDTGLHTARVSAHDQDALSRTRSHLAAASVALKPGQQDGDDGGGFAWRVTTTPVGGPAAGSTLYVVRVTVSWTMDGGRREMTLVTERLGEAGAPVP